MPDICGDNRFEVIAEYKKRLIEGTNIESRPEEMAVIDSILFRFWQMGWIPEHAADVEPKQRWIPVTERLPKVGEDVLVFAVEKSNDFPSVIAISDRMIFRLFPASDGVETWRSPWQSFMTNYEITHWMPLPEPPKEEKEA